MPTNLDRIQTLLQPDAYAKVRSLAKANRRALSAMSAELVEEALKLPKYRQQIEDAEIQVPTRDDPRTDDKQKGLVKTIRESYFEPRSNPHERLAARIKEEADAGRFHPQMPDIVEVDGHAYAADLTAEDVATSAAQQAMVDATHVQPIKKTREHQDKIVELFRSGAITQEEVNKLMSAQLPQKGQPREEKEVDMRGDLFKTIGEQDDRLKKMEEMMGQMAAMMAAKG